MHTFIKAMALHFNLPGLEPRANAVFEYAMSQGVCRWGQRATLLAGASFAYALRESGRPDNLYHISLYLGKPLLSLNRVFFNTLDLYKGAQVAPVDHAGHLPLLEKFLSDAIEEGAQGLLPLSLVNSLRSISLLNAFETARNFASHLLRLSPSTVSDSTKPTVVALTMLGLESELRASLPDINQLATCLGSCFNIGKVIVMRRYNLMQDDLLPWTEQLPWIDKLEKVRGRNKVPKRVHNARALRDVLSWQDDIWKKLSESDRPKVIVLEGGEDEMSDTDSISSSSSSRDMVIRPPATKRRKTAHRAVDIASHFLLNPYAIPLPSLDYSSSSSNQSTHHTRCSYLHLSSYLLAAPSFETKPPTRLRALVVERGAADRINDDELFEADEWDMIRRTDEEIQQLALICDFDPPTPKRPKTGKKRKRNDQSSVADPEGSSRINRDNLTAFFNEGAGGGPFMDDLLSPEDVMGLLSFDDRPVFAFEVDEKGDDSDYSVEGDVGKGDDGSPYFISQTTVSEALVLGEWHPPSP